MESGLDVAFHASRKPAPRFTAEEKSMLISFVNKYKKVLECKKTDVASLSAKTQAWKRLCAEYNAQHGVTARDFKQLKKCWGNLKQKWKEEKSEEKRKILKTGGGPAPAGMTTTSVLVGAVASHMATRIRNDDDSDGAVYLPPVQSEPVIRLLQPMITGNDVPVSQYYEELSNPDSRLQDAVMETGNDGTTTPQPPDSNEMLGACAANDASSQPPHAPCSAGANSTRKDSAPLDAVQIPVATTRPSSSRMALLEKTLSEENDIRVNLMREEHELRMRILQEDHDDILKKRDEKHKLEMEILQARKDAELRKVMVLREQ
ncbi:uncharacterized protein LOC142577984 isoform X1 [Dermacentor variabilis]|uniref:uncharacterized protein LOC142577984 isoform X1 n=1 Tax=Dermacentor variabilis TaxID=34621 RepID=UPI003F5BAA27